MKLKNNQKIEIIKKIFKKLINDMTRGDCEGHIPLGRKTTNLRVGGSSNVKICIGNTNMLVSKDAKICLTPNAKHKIAFPQTQTPNANQWNIGIYGFPTRKFTCTFHFC